MFISTRKPSLFLCLVAVLAVAGCSKEVPVAEVSGIIKLDGKPMPNTKILFMPDQTKGTLGPISAGLSDDQGHFKLSCEDERSGAVIGWHKVVITQGGQTVFRSERKGRRDDDDPVKKAKVRPKGPAVPERYTNSGKTPLSQEVKENKNDIELTLSK